MKHEKAAIVTFSDPKGLFSKSKTWTSSPGHYPKVFWHPNTIPLRYTPIASQWALMCTDPMSQVFDPFSHKNISEIKKWSWVIRSGLDEVEVRVHYSLTFFHTKLGKTYLHGAVHSGNVVLKLERVKHKLLTQSWCTLHLHLIEYYSIKNILRWSPDETRKTRPKVRP